MIYFDYSVLLSAFHSGLSCFNHFIFDQFNCYFDDATWNEYWVDHSLEPTSSDHLIFIVEYLHATFQVVDCTFNVVMVELQFPGLNLGTCCPSWDQESCLNSFYLALAATYPSFDLHTSHDLHPSRYVHACTNLTKNDLSGDVLSHHEHVS